MLRKMQISLSIVQSVATVQKHFQQYPPVFIIGSPRSGTTLTLKLFQNQPQITALFEPFKIWRKAFRYSEDDSYSSNLNWLGFLALKYFYYEPITPNKPFLVVKDPRDSIRVNTLNQLFPQAKFIHIIRDGRDVIASMSRTFVNDIYLDIEDKWPHVRIPNYKTMLNDLPHINAARQWHYCVETSLEHLAVIPQDRQLTFYYEDLVNQSVEVSKKILNFAYPDLEFESTQLKKVTDSISNQVVKNCDVSGINNSISEKTSWQEKMKQFSSQVSNDAGSGTTANSLRVSRWQQDLNDEILADCYPIIGDTLKKLGYL
jgi:hypothetical protein